MSMNDDNKTQKMFEGDKMKLCDIRKDANYWDKYFKINNKIFIKLDGNNIATALVNDGDELLVPECEPCFVLLEENRCMRLENDYDLLNTENWNLVEEDKIPGSFLEFV